MRLGIFIGSFNPVHEGHIKIVNYLIDNNYVDKVLIIPSINYWNKQNLIELKHRINMLKFFESNNIKVDDKHNNYQYTYQLLRALKEEYNDELYLIIGADNAINLDKWEHIQELLTYKIIVLNRDNIDIKKYVDRFNQKDNFIIIDNFDYVPISSSKIRQNYLDEELKKYLDDRVLDYIQKNLLDKK